ncbi:MAG TPA: alpha/beta fold hydrolase [Kribbellaceae bacterium]|jgi:surfactin synthase thioesterase subunit
MRQPAAVLSVAPLVTPPDRNLVRFEARPAAPLRLFCFPWSGASASVYRELARSMPDEVETVAVQLPGRGSRRDESAFDRLAPLARQVVRALDVELRDRPGRFVLFGHSFGALLAYEVARQLQASGRHPELVVLSGSRAPARAPRVFLHPMGDAELLAALDQMGGTKMDRLRDPAFLDYFLPLVRTDLTACETFQPATGTLHCPVSVWGGSDDWYARPEDITRWRHFAGPAFRSRIFDGGHFFTSDEGVVREAMLDDLRWSRRYQDHAVTYRRAA